MPRSFYSPPVGSAPPHPEVSFYPVSAPPSLAQLLELAPRLWPGVPLDRIRFPAGMNCFHMGPGESATEPIVCNPASAAAAL